MKREKFLILACLFIFCFWRFAQGQQDAASLKEETSLEEKKKEPSSPASQASNPTQEEQAIIPSLEAVAAEKEAAERDAVRSENVTLDFKEADIQNVLKIISYKSGVNIVTTPDVMGNVTIRLVDVPWETALDVILKTYGFGFQRQGNIILVTKLENISKLQAEEPLQTEIFKLKFLDAQDAQKILIPLLSPRGKISVLYTKGQKGWRFGTFKIGKEEAQAGGLEREKAGEGKLETISLEKGASVMTPFCQGDFKLEPALC